MRCCWRRWSPTDAKGRVADLGAGAGAAGMAVAVRAAGVSVDLVERSPQMADFARRSIAMPENVGLAGRLAVIVADVTATGAARVASGLADEVYDHVIMNPPFNDPGDRRTPDPVKAEAHAMAPELFESWLRTAGAIMKPGGQIALIARPSSLVDILNACGRRFGGLEITAILPRATEDAIRILVTGIKGSRARLKLRPPLVMHDGEGHAFSATVNALNNGERDYPRADRRTRPGA
jgi:tRNA1(Val) A37 N6-methylase TrmN6